MSDASVAFEVPHIFRLERLVRKAHALDDFDAVVVDCDAGGLLAPVL